jgi:glycerate kinase
VGLVVDATGLKSKAVGAQYCITGEGGIDFQTRYGKTPVGVAQAVKEVAPDCTIVALAGNVGKGIEQLYDSGIDAIFGILPGACTLEEAITPEQAQANLSRTAENAARLFV